MAAQTQDLQRLVVAVEARLDKFNKDMAKLSRISDATTKRVAKDFATLESKLSRFGAGVNRNIAGIFAGLTVGATARFAQSAIKDLAAIKDGAEKAGLSIRDFQKLTFAALKSGGGADDIVSVFEKFNQLIGQAAAKGGELADLLKANGVDIVDNNGNMRKNVDIWFDVLDLIKNAKNEIDRARITTLAMGKGAQDLLPAFLEGSEGIKTLAAEAEKAGFVIDDKLIKKADEFDDAWSGAFAAFTINAKASVVQLGQELENLGRIMRGDKIISGDAWRDLANVVFAGDVRQHHPKPRTSPPPSTVVPGTPEKAAKEAKEEFKDAIELTEQEIKAFENLITEMDDARDATKGFVSDLVSGLRQGLSATEALGQAFENLADKMINKLLDQAVDQLLGPAGTAGTGLIGKLLGFNLKGQDRLTPGAPELPGGTAPIIPVAQQILETIARKAQPPGVKTPPIDLTDAGGVVKAVEEMLDLSPKVPVIPVTSAPLAKSILSRMPGYEQIAPSPADPLGAISDLLGLLRSFLGGGLAAGGPAMPNHPVLVGEKGPEVFMPRVPGIVSPNAGGGGGTPRFVVEARPNPYFDIRVRQISGHGDAQTLDSARRGYPSVASRFAKLGTTSK